MFIALCFIALVASFSIVANLIMMATEKAKEIAILKSMGARDGAIVRIFFGEGLYIGLVGMTIGVTCGVLSCRLLERFGLPLPAEVYYIEKLPIVMRGERDRARSAWRRWRCVAWPPSTPRCWRRASGRSAASGTNSCAASRRRQPIQATRRKCVRSKGFIRPWRR